MLSDDLSLACRLSGLSVRELWLRYLATGGALGESDVAARIAGARWPEWDEIVLATVADEALTDLGLPRLAANPVSPRVATAPSDCSLSPCDAGRGPLDELIARCVQARAQARGIRTHAQLVRYSVVVARSRSHRADEEIG